MPLEEYDLWKKQRTEDNIYLPLRGIVANTAPENESVNIDAFGTSGAPEFAVRHPFFGVNSWIRVMPEPGTSVLVQRRGDIHQEEIWGYISNKTSAVLRAANRDRNFPMRVLQAGEIDLMSAGRASAFLGNGGDLELRGGLLSHILSQSELEVRSTAPTFSRKLHLNSPTTVAHEERFGVVKRPSTTSPNSVQEIKRNADNTFAMEYGRWLNTKAGQTLVQLQEGNVYDSTGQAKTQNSTSKPLRYERQIHHKTSGFITLQVDEELNIFYNNASQAKETIIQFGGKNEVTAGCKKMTVSGTDAFVSTFTNSMSLTSNKVQVNSTNVLFGSNAIQPAVLGANLTSSVLTPLFSALIAFFNGVIGDPGLSAVIKSAAAGAGSVVSQAQSQINSVLSTQVKLTA